MPDNKIKQQTKRSFTNSSSINNDNKQQLGVCCTTAVAVVENKTVMKKIPHCSLLVFETKNSMQSAKKRENPFDGSCDISNILQNGSSRGRINVSNDSCVSPTNQATDSSFESKKRKKRKLSTDFLNQNRGQQVVVSTDSNNSPTLNQRIVSNEQHQIYLSNPMSSSSSSMSNTSSTNSFSKIPQYSPNRNQTNSIPLLSSMTTMGIITTTDSNKNRSTANEFVHDPFKSIPSPHLNNGETRNYTKEESKSNSLGLSCSFFEDISSSILYLVTGKKDHERIKEESLPLLITKQQPQQLFHCNALIQQDSNGNENRLSILSNNNKLPSSLQSAPAPLNLLHDHPNMPNQSIMAKQPVSYGNCGPSLISYLFPNPVSTCPQPVQSIVDKESFVKLIPEKSIRTKVAMIQSDDESDVENSIQMLPSIASLLERQ